MHITLNKKPIMANGNRIAPNHVIMFYSNNKFEIVLRLPSKKDNAFLLCYEPEKGYYKRYAKRNESDYIRAYWKNHKPRHNNKSYKHMMKHERVHKKGGGGKMENKYAITEYECTKFALNDFPQSMWVQYNH